MRLEIERKFLVTHDGWRAEATGCRDLKDGLIGQFDRGKVRVRLADDRAWITVKGARDGLARPEFEYEIPRDDAQAMLGSVCVGCIVEKTRHRVPHGDLTWEIDVFHGRLAGVVLAEVELEHEDQPVVRPDWLGTEVTGDLRFRQSTLLHLCNQMTRAITLDDLLALPPHS